MFARATILFCALASFALGAPFTPGNVVVYRVGDGTALLANTGNVVFLDEITPAGALVQSVAMPTVLSGAHKRLVSSGTASSEGFLQRSVDGRYLIATGYDSALPAAASIATTAAARVIGRVDASGVIDTTTALTDAATLNNPRSACSIDGTAFWFGGGAGGVRYATLGAAASTDLTTAALLSNVRQPAIFGGRLYASSQNGTNTFRGVSVIGMGTPTTGAQTVTRLNGLTDLNATGVNMFFLADLTTSVAGPDTLYMADEDGLSGGLTKFSLVGGTWTANGIVGAGSSNYRGLTGSVVGGSVTLFATRANGLELVSLTDRSGYNGILTGNPTLLRSAATNTALRGVALAPQAILPDLKVEVSAPANAAPGASFSYSIVVSNTGTTAASGISVRFTLPAGLSFGSGSGTQGFSASHSVGIVTFSGGTLAAGAQATLSAFVSTSATGSYTASAGSVVADPTFLITEALETNNSNTTAATTIVSPPNTPPSFTQHPASVTIANGTTATLNVVAIGNPVPTLQWYQGLSGDTSTPISAADGTSYTTPALFLNANYWVRATNGSGIADSGTALVSVLPSTDASLSALVIDGLMAPAFTPLVTSYATFVAPSTASITVTPTTTGAYATTAVNGQPVTSGSPSAAIALEEGSNLINTVVTAQDGVTTRTYILQVFRSAPALSAGAIAFVGWNADGSDDLAFVALTAIPANSVIHFSDNEWNGQPLGGGGAFVDFTETEFVWMPPVGGLAAGSVVTLSNLATVTTASVGTFYGSDGAARGLSAAAESVYAFMGATRSPSAFLASISSDSAIQLIGTGLTTGTTAVQLATSSDGAAFTGQRSGQVGYANYLAHIGNVTANWSDVPDGTTLLPFSTASFSLTGSAIYTHINRDVLNPNHDVWTAGGVSLNGLQFVNLGLQGVGRVPAGLINASTGETIGSISDLQVSGFTPNGNGSYSGTFHFMPDRGYSAGGINPNTAARINTFSFTFTPYTAPAPTTLQNQVAMTFTGATRFTHDHDGNPSTADAFTTGITPTAVATRLGGPVPVAGFNITQSDGTRTGRMSITGEGLILDRRAGKAGTGWLSDEFGPGIYHFDANKRIDGRLTVPEAFLPRLANGSLDFGTDTPVSGRRENQGFEGLAQSPDGTRLFAMLQSATVQDSDSGNEGRFNTRLLVYDISSTDAPTAPVAEYVMQLPRIDETGSTSNGNNVNRTGSQCALVALTNRALLVLSRDGNGRGTPGNAPVFKSILLADLSAATDILGSYDAAEDAVAPSGVLEAGVTPVSWTQALNLLGGLGSVTTEVAKFGLNLTGGNGGTHTLSDKWEGLSLVPCGDVGNPNDFFLFVGNDNNYQSVTGRYLGSLGTIQNYNAGLAHDSMVLAYRVRIVAPSIGVRSEGAEIADAGPVSSVGLTLQSAPVTREFVIRNAGTTVLSSISTSIDGADAAAFSVSVAPSTSVASADSTSLTVSFQSANVGIKTATLHILSSAPGSLASYDIPLTAEVISTTPIRQWRLANLGSVIASDVADSDHDGMANLLEYGLGTLPQAHSPDSRPTASIPGSPALLAGRLTLSFETAEITPTDASYTVQINDGLNPSLWTDLATKVGNGAWAWLGGGTSRIISTTAAGRTSVQIADPQPATMSQRHMRLKVSVTP